MNSTLNLLYLHNSIILSIVLASNKLDYNNYGIKIFNLICSNIVQSNTILFTCIILINRYVNLYYSTNNLEIITTISIIFEF